GAQLTRPLRGVPAPVRGHGRRQRLGLPDAPRGVTGQRRHGEGRGGVHRHRGRRRRLRRVPHPARVRAVHHTDRVARASPLAVRRRVRRHGRRVLGRVRAWRHGRGAGLTVLDTRPGAPDAPAAGARVDSHCPYCALQCGMSLTPAAGSAAPEVQPRDFPTNRGGLCQKGWTSAVVLNAPDRLTRPLVRRSLLDAALPVPDGGGPDDPLVPVPWDTALDLVATRLAALSAEHGPQAVAVFGGGGLTNEKAYALGKFARTVLRTPNIDYNGRFCMASAAAGMNRAFGVDRGLPFPLADLGGA